MGTELYAQKRDGEEREGQGSEGLQESRCRAFGGHVCQVGILHTASFLQTLDLQERGTQGLHSRVCQVGVLPANHRASECALERCLEGFAALDGHKSVPSREPIWPGGT